MTIVKVQVPLHDPGGLLLVYPEGKGSMQLQPPTKAVIAALNGDPKGYFEADLSRDGWIIGKRIAAQSW